MSYDPLLQRAKEARDHLRARIRKTKQELADAKTRLGVLEELEIGLDLDAIVDAVPTNGGVQPSPTP